MMTRLPWRLPRGSGERFDEALLAFEKAADLPFLSRFVTGYLLIAAGAGALLAGLFVARGRWGGASDAIFVAWVVLLISVLLWASFRRAAGQRRAVRSRDPAKWLQLDALSHLRPALERTYRDWVRAMARDGLLPLLNDRLGEEPPAYTTELHGLELEPLSGSDERDDHFVPTDASRRVSLLIEELSSASIGLSGVRGAGKSTVLRQLCDPERHPDNDLRLLVHAPTAYDSREFLTHLFIRVCERVVGDRGPGPRPLGGSGCWRCMCFRGPRSARGSLSSWGRCTGRRSLMWWDCCRTRRGCICSPVADC